MTSTIEHIYQWREKVTDQEHRGHLGCSEVGMIKQCQRKVYYSFNWCKSKHVRFSGRILRLFASGKVEEGRLVKELKAIGVDIQEFNPETGKQWHFAEFCGILAGSCDGIALNGTPDTSGKTLFEFKTANQKSFDDLLKKGLKESKFTHYAQMQMYMGLSQLWSEPLTIGMYLCVNKNTDDIYQEVVNYDADFYRFWLDQAKRIITAKEPPPKCSENPAWFECKMCDFFDICHEDAVPPVSCRTCTHFSANPERGYECLQHNILLGLNEQREACGDHLYNPKFIHAKPIDSDAKTFVQYERKDGYQFKNVVANIKVAANEFYSSELCCKSSAETMSDQLVNELKSTFPGTKLIERPL